MCVGGVKCLLIQHAFVCVINANAIHFLPELQPSTRALSQRPWTVLSLFCQASCQLGHNAITCNPCLRPCGASRVPVTSTAHHTFWMQGCSLCLLHLRALRRDCISHHTAQLHAVEGQQATQTTRPKPRPSGCYSHSSIQLLPHNTSVSRRPSAPQRHPSHCPALRWGTPGLRNARAIRSGSSAHRRMKRRDAMATEFYQYKARSLAGVEGGLHWVEVGGCLLTTCTAVCSREVGG